MKRLISTLLACSLLLTTSALAATDINAGTGSATLGNGGVSANSSGWSSRTANKYGPGLLIHVEKVPDVTFTYGSDGKIANLVDLGEYWATHFPNTDPNDGELEGVYLLPTHRSSYSKQYSIVHEATHVYDYVELESYMWMGDRCPTLRNDVGADAYRAALTAMTTANPNLSLSPSYWRDVISSMSLSSAQTVIQALYSPANAERGMQTAEDGTLINDAVDYYISAYPEGQKDTWIPANPSASQFTISDDYQASAINFLYYCALLAAVIRCCPDHERSELAAQLDVMCQDYLGGKEYSPMVVTAELVITSEFNGNAKYCYWWTPQQCLASVTGVNIPDDITNWVDLRDRNRPLNQIARYMAGKPSTMRGGLIMYGIYTPKKSGFRQYTSSNGAIFPVWGTLLTSLSVDTIGQWGGKDYHTLDGFGVWGVKADYVKQTIIYTAESEVSGKCGVDILNNTIVLEEGATEYSQILEVELSIELDGSVTEITNVNGTVTETQAGPCFADIFDWLYIQQQSGLIVDTGSGFRYNGGATIGYPNIDFYCKVSDAVSKVEDAAASNLISLTDGYSGNGLEAHVNGVIPNNLLESTLGQGTSTWDGIVKVGTFTIKGLEGSPFIFERVSDQQFRLTIKDLAAAYAYFKENSGTLKFTFDIPIAGTISGGETLQYWVAVGVSGGVPGPASTENLQSLTLVTTDLQCCHKYDYVSIIAPEVPIIPVATYHSEPQPAYSEYKQGTVPTTGTGSSETFNAMTGTPTNYTQYFASGGSEYVVQFKAERMEGNASRTFKWEFTAVDCGSNTGDHGDTSCGSHSTTGGENPQPIPCTSECAHCGNPVHDKRHRHYMAGTASMTIAYSGFSYMKITDLKVWKLSQAKLDGTRELLETDEIYATVQTTAPAISYNIASANTSAAGRLVYAFMPEMQDTVTFTHALAPGCGTDGAQIQAFIEADLAGATLGAWCVSDYIVLHTSNGDQSILYYEYQSNDYDTPILGSVSGSSGSPVAGTSYGSASIVPTMPTVTFESKSFDDMWTNNGETAEGCALPADGITYGGYNGQFSAPDTKYESTGYDANMTRWSSTQVYLNTSGAYTEVAGGGVGKCFRGAVTPKFRLLKDGINVGNDEINGEYILGNSYVFYENVINYGSDSPYQQILAQSKFDNKVGFILPTTYSPNHGKINDIVLYNPVSVQNAIVVSLPDSRDQRIATSSTRDTDKTVSCPGDATCDYLRNECTITQHVHDESCYTALEYLVPPPSDDGALEEGMSAEFSYTGGMQSILLDPGVYRLEAWGAKGADLYQWSRALNNGTTTLPRPTLIYSGALGGYSAGTITLTEATTLCVGVGARGEEGYQLFNSITPGCGGYTHFGLTPTDVWHTSVSDLLLSAEGGGCASYMGEGVAGGANNYFSPTLTSPVSETGVNPVRGGDGYAKITCLSTTASGYTVNKAALSCTDPHHAYSYNWKLYTYGLRHTDGTICTGRSCSNTTALVFPTQEEYTVAQCAAGYIVQHSSGAVHLTTSRDTCTYCDRSYATLLSGVQTSDRTPAATEYSCYAYGDTRCWQPCGNAENHRDYVNVVSIDGQTHTMGYFLNLDWEFQVYFPNTGNFYGTGAEYSSSTSAERGKGYTNGMDCTEWTKDKWVVFPFNVVYNGVTYRAYEEVHLPVEQVLFDFYLPLNNYEMANAEIQFCATAINSPRGTLECGANETRNTRVISYSGKRMSHPHSASKYTYIDLVGRVGAIALNDTGDWRFSNLFKMSTGEWRYKNLLYRVDITKQNYMFHDEYDVRGVHVTATGVGGNTYGTISQRASKLLSFPLTPLYNKVLGSEYPASTALLRQPLRVGYDSFFDLSTLGNYYGNTVLGEDGSVEGQNSVLIKTHYYRLDLETGETAAVDAYMDVNGSKVLINDADADISTIRADTQVYLNWTEEQARRCYTGNSEESATTAVAAAYPWVVTPHGSRWVYGNYDLLKLTDRNRTFIGSEYTYRTHRDPSNKLYDVQAGLQGQRWHFNVGLPSSTVFVYSGKPCTTDNIAACASGNAVVLCALEIYVQGEVWTLAYDGAALNAPFGVTPDGTSYDPVIYYPTTYTTKQMEMPIVSIISINHSSAEDLTTAGTH